MELSMDNMDIIAGGILAIMLALFMLTVIVTLIALSQTWLSSNEIYRIEKQVSDYIDELSRSESDKLEIEHKVHQDGVISSVLQEIFP